MARSGESEKRVLDWIDAHQDRLVELLQGLVRIRSIYGQEGDAQRLVRERMGEICDSVDAWEPDAALLEAHPSFFAKGQSYAGRPNVVGILEGSGSGPSLLLNAHIDVVPAQPENEWAYGAWSAEVRDGSLHGRGSLDDKSGIAMMITVASALRECGVRLAGQLQLHSVIDEEWGGSGTLAAVQRGHIADAGIILEPVGPDIFPASRGGQAFRVCVEGKGAHPVASWTGVSAIEKAMVIISDLKKLESERQDTLRTPLFDDYPIFVPIVVGKISADLIPSKVPEKCEFEGLFGYSPQEHWSEARRVFEDRVALAASRDPWLTTHPPTVRWIGLNKEGAAIDAEHPLVLCLRDAVTSATGKTPKVRGYPAGTDLPLLVLYGRVPSVLFGVECTWGDSHSSTEHVELRHLVQATRSLAVTVMRWCGVVE
jgi:acetylornithine deacetylase